MCQNNATEQQTAVQTNQKAPAEAKGDTASSVTLLLCFAFWYLGNYYFNLYNKKACNEAGGPTGSLTMTVATVELGIGAVYAIIVWMIGINPLTFTPQKLPKLTGTDLWNVTQLAAWSAAAHAGSIFAFNAGSVAFGQIVKAAEPVFAAAIGTLLYSKPPSFAKACMLPIIICGVAIACLKPDASGNYKVEFEVVAMTAGSVANIAASFRGSENAKLMALPGLKERIGGVGNQFALAQVLGFLVLLPVALITEGAHLDEFVSLVKSNGYNNTFVFNLLGAGMTFYVYNELSTMTIKYTSAVTMSVANTAKRVIVIVGVALALGKPLTNEEIVGSAVAISGVFLYSVADKLMPKKTKTA